MKRFLYTSIVISVSLFALFYSLFKLTDNVIAETLYITFMTFSYHFIMRLVVGMVTNPIFHKVYDYNNWWFKQKKFEKRFYKILKVKDWKEKVPSWSPGAFSLKDKSLHNIAVGMCNAELVHEIIVFLSFVPILFSIKYGVPAVFICTSILAGAFDMIFVIIQRYNRPRIIKLMRKNLQNNS